MRCFTRSICFFSLFLFSSFNLLSKNGSKEFYNAIKEGDLQKVKMFIKKEGVDVVFPPDFAERSHIQPIHMGAYFGKLSIVKYLIEEKKVDVNKKCFYRENTALHYASEEGKTGVVRYLIEKQANIEERSDCGMRSPPFLLACHSNNIRTVKVFLVAGADVNACKSEELDVYTGIFAASRNNNKDLLKLLVMYDADINKSLLSPLYYACKSKDFELIRFLVEWGVKIEDEIKYEKNDINCYLAIAYLFDKSENKIKFVQDALRKHLNKISDVNLINLLCKRVIHTLCKKDSLFESYYKLYKDLKIAYKKDKILKKAIKKRFRLPESFSDVHFSRALIKTLYKASLTSKKIAIIKKGLLAEEFRKKLYFQVSKKRSLNDLLIKCV